jgi:hypothetical protein
MLLSLGTSKELAFKIYLVFRDFKEYLGVILPLVLGTNNYKKFIGKLLENSIHVY